MTATATRDWRPIATMTEHPVGVSMLVWVPDNLCTFAVTRDGQGKLFAWGPGSEKPFPFEPSHWMPMPEPPKDSRP